MGWHLQCTGCTQKFPFPQHYFSYTDLPKPADAVEHSTSHFWPMLLEPIWCLHCDCASYVERVPSRHELYAAAALRRLPKKPYQDLGSDELLDLEEHDFQRLYQHCLNRGTSTKCVLCGKSTFIRFDENQRETGLRHEQCWGSPIELRRWWLGAYCGGPYNSTGRYYNQQGFMVWATAFYVERYSFCLQIVLHNSAVDADYAQIQAAIECILNEPNAEPEAAAMLNPLIEREVPAALGLLGALHYVGQGVPHDGKRAMTLLTQAMQMGDVAALHNLACLLSTGAPGVAIDRARALQLFQEARQSGGQFVEDGFYRQFAAEEDFCWQDAFYRPNPR